MVAKTDPITFATDEAGWYAVHVNANDVAAMGATPRFFLASVILPEEQATEALVESVFRSIDEAARQLGIAVCGGHTEITHGIDRPIVVGQMLGDVDCGKVVRSSGLAPGDAVLLTKGMAVEGHRHHSAGTARGAGGTRVRRRLPRPLRRVPCATPASA